MPSYTRPWPAGKVGIAYNQAISVSGSETWELSYVVVSGTGPNGLKISQPSPGGMISISGKATATGSFTIKVKARDALGVVVVRTYTVTIS